MRPTFHPQHGLPHPPSKFALPGVRVAENTFSQEVLDAIHNLSLEEPDTMQYQSSHWLLMESETLFRVCEQAGIDGEKLRKHLRRVETGEYVESEDEEDAT